MNTRNFLSMILLAVAIPAAMISCNKDTASKPAVEAKYHYAVAMTGVV